uniref:Cytochrome P450 family 39 subfamily A member 1 n=1 Tax=Latimeria chalumnae TaxID=7897 RepID=H3AEJ7_LATCH
VRVTSAQGSGTTKSTMELGIILFTLALLFVAYIIIFQKRYPNSPPCITGWIPWFGAAFQFGKAPLEFIEDARVKYGPVFTVVAAGNRMTFVTEEEGFNLFFTSKDVDFQEAVQDPVQHTASISKESFYKNHTATHDMLKGRLAPSNLHLFSEGLCQEFTEHLQYLGEKGTEELSDLVRHVMYPAVVNNLFGKGICPTSKDAIKEFEEHFLKFDEDFEYGSQLPEIFLTNWSKSKQWLLSVLEKVVENAERTKPSDNNSKTLLQHLLETLNGNGAPNYCLLMLWASQANAVPVTFWSLAFIVSHPSVYKTAMDKISSVFGKKGKDSVKVSETHLHQLCYIKWCILEAIRLCSPGAIARKVIRPLKVQNYIIPPGDMLMMSPFWAHRNPKYFPEPEQFIPERWRKADLEKNVFLDGFVAFGGGRYQCPGRWFALMEIHMLVIMMLYSYEFTLLDPLPKQ